jgi:hypothetical protein
MSLNLFTPLFLFSYAEELQEPAEAAFAATSQGI